MTTLTIREKLHQQIDKMPDVIVEQIADFTLFMMAKHRVKLTYTDWEEGQWEEFSLAQFLRDGDEVEYTLDDATEVYEE